MNIKILELTGSLSSNSNKTAIYFDSFGMCISNIYRIQAYDSVMCGYFCIEFIDYMFNGKSLINYTNLFSPNDFKKNDNIILNLF